ncbi:ribosomal protein L7/L12 [Nocardioides sp. zg-536]|uniref:Ribosomal protein L7/L12 n=1 Tax=Nocardioides faecalis TaxID=2803858 RepID=A0A938Y4W9_9ACTN|nr:ribosomal protein L7/L12 [Nocardioides faecalis]MBM9459284.1 ribosomal protein L7/L12 [Nocardioides faecalis]QVI59590.1 ribosomal protein L7/L12 [Nocardioides faecalis]
MSALTPARPPRQGPLGIALRGGPRVVLMVVLAVGALTSDSNVMRIVAALLFVLNAGRLLDPDWRRFVVTGLFPERVEAQYCQPGEHSVELVAVGPRHVEVIKALREVDDLDLVEAKALLKVPAVVVEDLSADSAAAVAKRLTEAGATVRVLDPVG